MIHACLHAFLLISFTRETVELDPGVFVTVVAVRKVGVPGNLARRPQNNRESMALFKRKHDQTTEFDFMNRNIYHVS